MFAGFTQRLNFGMGGGTVSIPSAFPTRPIGQLGNFNTYAINFIAATGITASEQQAAINQLSTDLVNTGLMDKMYAVYPFVGGTSTTHQYNLKDPRDTNGSYRLTFSGGMTHSSTGVQFGGVNGSANTWFNPSFFGVNNNCHISFYSRTLNSTTGYEFGFNNSIILICNYGPQSQAYGGFGTLISIANTNTRGFFVNNSLSNVALFRNGSQLTNTTTAIFNPNTVATTYNLTLGADYRVSGAIDFSTKECAFASIGRGLTTAEHQTFYTIVQNFQTTLGRQV
jgi:hypothetical protein